MDDSIAERGQQERRERKKKEGDRNFPACLNSMWVACKGREGKERGSDVLPSESPLTTTFSCVNYHEFSMGKREERKVFATPNCGSSEKAFLYLH